MAKPSGGTVTAPKTALDANQAVALLARLHHWRCTKVNDSDGVYYEVTITHGGCRVTACRRSTFVHAANAALLKLWERAEAKGKTHSLRLAALESEASSASLEKNP